MHGIFGQINYTLSETRSDSIGDASQNRIEPFLDNARPRLDAGYSIYHNAHVINANAIVELPFGQGKRWLNGRAQRCVARWLAARDDRQVAERRAAVDRVRRAARSTAPGDPAGQTAATSLTAEQIKAPVRRAYATRRSTSPSSIRRLIGSDGRLVAPDSLCGAGFNGQAFFNPGAGEVGNLEVNLFEGPSQFVTDLTV